MSKAAAAATPDLFEFRPTRRRLTRRERRAAVAVLAYVLVSDSPPPRANMLHDAREAMDKLKVLKKRRF